MAVTGIVGKRLRFDELTGKRLRHERFPTASRREKNGSSLSFDIRVKH
jgi:hypothetical protein